MDEAEYGLHDLLLERLLDDDEVAGPILAAWAGDEELAALAAGRPAAASDPTQVPPRALQLDTYLALTPEVSALRGKAQSVVRDPCHLALARSERRCAE